MQILKEQTRLIQQLLPMGAKNKPGRSMTPKYITMHNTGNTAKGADARAHASYLSSGASGQKVSWHYTVDDEVIYQHLSDTEQGWHAADGRGPGNSQSIGIEVCMNEGIDQARAEANAAQLVAQLMHKHGIPLANVTTHQHWHPSKYCPALILPHWDKFVAAVQTAYNGGEAQIEVSKGHSVLVKWSKGEEVKELQSTLNSLGYTLEVDGTYGPATEAAVRDFQGKHSLDVDGKVGPATWAALEQEPVSQGHSVLVKWSKGAEVKELQSTLNSLGYTLDVDGTYGPATEAAVRDFQGKHSLEADGKTGPKTWTALAQATAEKNDTLYRVQIGAYKDKSNAEAAKAAVEAAGFEAIIKMDDGEG